MSAVLPHSQNVKNIQDFMGHSASYFRRGTSANPHRPFPIPTLGVRWRWELTRNANYQNVSTSVVEKIIF